MPHSLANLTNDELVSQIQAHIDGAVQTLEALKPLIEEAYRRIDSGQKVDGCASKKEFCERVIGRTARAVRYMLSGGNKKRTEYVKAETVSVGGQPTTTPGAQKLLDSGYNPTEVDWTTILKPGDVALIANYFGRSENPSHRLAKVARVTPSTVTVDVGDGYYSGDFRFVHGTSSLNKLILEERTATPTELKVLSFAEWRFADGTFDPKINGVAHTSRAVNERATAPAEDATDEVPIQTTEKPPRPCVEYVAAVRKQVFGLVAKLDAYEIDDGAHEIAESLQVMVSELTTQIERLVAKIREAA